MSWQQVSAMGAGNGSGMPGSGMGGGQEMQGGGGPNPGNQPHATEYTLQGMIQYLIRV